MSVNPSIVQRARHESAHSSVVRGTRHTGRPKGHGFAAHTDPQPNVSSQHPALGAPGLHLGPGRPTGDVRADDQADETKRLTAF